MTSWRREVAVLTRAYQEALSLADEAIAVSPGQLWLYGNRADALMPLGRADEARALCLAHREETLQDGWPWEDAVEGDFHALRNFAIDSPLMAEIEAAFANPAEPTPAK